MTHPHDSAQPLSKGCLEPERTLFELYWLAGLLEGEGCFISDPRDGHPAIALHMTDKDVVDRASEIMLGEIKTICRERGGNRRPSYYVGCGGEKASLLMRQILPYMGERRSEKIKIAIARAQARPGRKGCRHGVKRGLKPWTP